jgi:hypothetical protein
MENRDTGWEDLRVSATMMTVKGSQYSTPPEFTTILWNSQRGPSYSGLLGYSFGYGKGVFQSGYFHAQLPHSYKPGTDIEPHIHVRLDPADEGAAGQKLLLEFEYVWVNMGEDRPNNSTIISINHEVASHDLESDNLLISFGFISKPDAQISSLLDCRFSRITFDPNWSKNFWTPQGLENDSFLGNLIFKEFDFHYQKDSRGSAERYVK